MDSQTLKPRATEMEPTAKNLVSTPLWAMEEDTDRAIVVLRRSAEPVSSLEALEAQNELIIEQIRRTRDLGGIVVDMRQAPARNDPEFEDAMAHLRKEIYDSYDRVAVLLTSAVGVLQVNRLGRNENTGTFATLSEAAAIKFAMGQG